MHKVAFIALASLAMIGSAHGAQHDIFIAGGQSNANVTWQTAINNTLTASGKFTNPELVASYHSGNPLDFWYRNDYLPNRGPNYTTDFYDPASATQATLEQRVNTIVGAGDTYTIRGFFWFQGETDATNSANVPVYKSRFTSMISSLKSDLGITYNIPVSMALIWITNATEATYTNYNNFRNIQTDIANYYPQSSYVDTSTYTRSLSDGLHLIPSESTRLGNTMATQFIAAVPEPASLAVFGLLSAGVLLRRSRAGN